MVGEKLSLRQHWVIGRQFLSNAPCVLRVAYSEARKSVMGDDEAVIIPFTPHLAKKLKKVLDGR